MELESKAKKVQELEIEVKNSKYKSNHIVMEAESKSLAITQVNSRNDILNETLDKMKNEILNLKKLISSIEAEKFDLEKENTKLRKDSKAFEAQNKLWTEEKQHLISMLELKNHLL